ARSDRKQTCRARRPATNRPTTSTVRSPAERPWAASETDRYRSNRSCPSAPDGEYPSPASLSANPTANSVNGPDTTTLDRCLITWPLTRRWKDQRQPTRHVMPNLQARPRGPPARSRHHRHNQTLGIIVLIPISE